MSSKLIDFSLKEGALIRKLSQKKTKQPFAVSTQNVAATSGAMHVGM